jgi:hypothetical protein
MTTLTRTKEFAMSKTSTKVLTVLGFVVAELVIVYALVPLAITLWRLLTCPC